AGEYPGKYRSLPLCDTARWIRAAEARPVRTRVWCTEPGGQRAVRWCARYCHRHGEVEQLRTWSSQMSDCGRYGEPMVDRSNGYEGIAVQFLAGRGSARSTGVGVKTVRNWARTLPRAAAVLDLGCGSGFPITEVLVTEGLNVYAVDAAPSFV